MNKIREAFQRFMCGRYGSDRLNQVLLIVFLVCAVLDIFVDNVYFSVLLTSWEFLLIIGIYFRMFSRNVSKRYAENQKYLIFENKIRRFFGKTKYIQQQRKDFHIYTCPQKQLKKQLKKQEKHSFSVFPVFFAKLCSLYKVYPLNGIGYTRYQFKKQDEIW
mgnify:CR=1 FL=1